MAGRDQDNSWARYDETLGRQVDRRARSIARLSWKTLVLTRQTYATSLSEAFRARNATRSKIVARRLTVEKVDREALNCGSGRNYLSWCAKHLGAQAS